MSEIQLSDIIKSVKQPSFDDEMIDRLINDLNNHQMENNSYYKAIREEGAIERRIY